ncbi:MULTISPECIES: DUF192 domain-containing protein [unclassified Burkholderia]|uniref:DUF192 domain-containing protein n=1 Tax=unclassified Burkholderia TaxID=2613784 RepID=UPI001588AE36|nr:MULTISPECIES: DUF192 domain-containing protein [unclassified Burkholderia]
MRQRVLVVGGRVTGVRVAVTESARERMKGLLGRDALGPDEALLLARCGAVHTFGMRFAIDVLFVSRTNRVVAVHRGVCAGRILMHWRGAKTLEMASGAAARHGIGVGMDLEWDA